MEKWREVGRAKVIESKRKQMGREGGNENGESMKKVKARSTGHLWKFSPLFDFEEK